MLVVAGALLGVSLLTSEGDDTEQASAAKPRHRVEQPPPSEISYPGFYPASYEIEAIYTEEPRTISGTQEVRYVNAEGRRMESLHFRLWTNEEVFTDLGGGTDISSVTVDGKKARFTVEGTDLEVELLDSLAENATAEISLDFETSIPEIAAPFGHDSGVSSMGVWYPVLAVYDEDGWNLAPTTEFGEPYFAEVANYEVRLTLPRALTAVATGVERGRESSSESAQTLTYEAESVRDFALAIGDEFERVSRKIGETTVNVYHRPESAFRAERALDLASGSLAYFSETFGPYPYPEFDLVDAPLVAGTEYSTLTFANLQNTEDYVFDTVVPHEVAHQWWYVQVGNDQFAEPWLDESLATYSEWLSAGDAASRFPNPVPPTTPINTPVSGFPDGYTYQNVAYLRGAQLYRDLSYEIGEEKLLRSLGIYAKKYRYRTANTEDLISTLSQSAGEDLTPFFESYDVTYPEKD